MPYDRQCSECKKHFQINNQIRRKDDRHIFGSNDDESYLVTDTEGNNIIKKVTGNRSMGKTQDTGIYYCSKECYETAEVVNQL